MKSTARTSAPLVRQFMRAAQHRSYPASDAARGCVSRPLHVAFIGMLIVLSACSTSISRPAQQITGTDVLWLNRVGYSIDTATIAAYRRLGRAAYLETQLAAGDAPLPPPVAMQIDHLTVSHSDAAQLLAEATAESKRINALPDGPEKEQARKALNERGSHLAVEATRRHILRALYSPDQLKEQMVWFWLNHFSVFQYKANVRWLAADYEERAIRPHALGHFRELVMATLAHPAMLQYLDNAQNAAGHINENYARELMELHTLGVGAGYRQQDVQELARILTGAGINASSTEPRLRKDWLHLYRHAGAFEFNPARHDFATKTLLGRSISGQGFAEIEEAVALLTRQPSCARLISQKLATYFVADEPPPQLVAQMAARFQETDGDIAAVLRTMFAAPAFTASLGHKFRDPMHFVVATVRFSYDQQPIANTQPIVNWLNALGEPLYGRQTPDGYALTEASWASSGQMSRRFEIARAIASGNAGLFKPEDDSAPVSTGFPRLATRLFFEELEPSLSAQTRAALARAASQQEWNTLLLASPEFNYR